MESITYSGHVNIDNIDKAGRRKRIFSSHNKGSSALLDLLADALTYNKTVTEERKPWFLAFAKNGDNNNPAYVFLSDFYSPVENPQVTSESDNMKKVNLTYYLSSLDLKTGEENKNILLLLLPQGSTKQSTSTVLAEVDTGATTYKINENEAQVIQWQLQVSINGGKK